MQYGKIRFSHKSGVRKVQKKCCPVAKPRQHKQKYYRDQFSTILTEVQEWFQFGFTKEQILHLADNIRKAREQGK